MATETFEKQGAMVDDVVREVSRMRSTITEAVDEGVRSAMRAYQQGRDAAQEVFHDTERAVRKNPVGAVGVALGAGVLLGTLIGWLSTRR